MIQDPFCYELRHRQQCNPATFRQLSRASLVGWCSELPESPNHFLDARVGLSHTKIKREELGARTVEVSRHRQEIFYCRSVCAIMRGVSESSGRLIEADTGRWVLKCRARPPAVKPLIGLFHKYDANLPYPQYLKS